MEINWKAAVGTMVTGLICTAGGYIAGHASAMHQHATVAEQKKKYLLRRTEL